MNDRLLLPSLPSLSRSGLSSPPSTHLRLVPRDGREGWRSERTPHDTDDSRAERDRWQDSGTEGHGSPPYLTHLSLSSLRLSWLVSRSVLSTFIPSVPLASRGEPCGARREASDRNEMGGGKERRYGRSLGFPLFTPSSPFRRSFPHPFRLYALHLILVTSSEPRAKEPEADE